MRDLDLTTLRLFVAVCETRNIARAAEQQAHRRLGHQQAAGALEDTVGTPLLVRRRRGVEPTPAGETLLEHARAHAGRPGRASSATWPPIAAGVRGQVRILATASVMAESLADDVAAFLKQPEHRDIRVDIEERVSTGVVRGLREGLRRRWASAGTRPTSRACRPGPTAATSSRVVVPPAIPWPRTPRVRFAQTLDDEHVSLPPSSAVQLMLQRAAAAGRQAAELPRRGGHLRRRAARGARRPGHQRAARGAGPALRRRLRPAAWCLWPTPGPAAASPSPPAATTPSPRPRGCWWSIWGPPGALKARMLNEIDL